MQAWGGDTPGTPPTAGLSTARGHRRNDAFFLFAQSLLFPLKSHLGTFRDKLKLWVGGGTHGEHLRKVSHTSGSVAGSRP